MTALYLVSTESGAGKTAIGAGLGRRFEADGKSVHFSTDDSSAPGVTIIEGTIGNSPEDAATKAAVETARNLKAKIIIVAAYAGRPALKVAESWRSFKDCPAGLILNKVPRSQIDRACAEAVAACAEAGIKFLGALPEDRLLAALTVGELAQGIKGKVLNAAEKSNALVENLMLGALVVDSGPQYFARKSDKAAIIRNDRPDMQLAALETSTRCLVLSNGLQPPIPNVMIKAERKGVPVVLSEKGTEDIIAAIEDMLAKARFKPAGKLERMAALLPQRLDFKTIDEWAVG